MRQKADFSTPNSKNFTKFSASVRDASSRSPAKYGFATKYIGGKGGLRRNFLAFRNEYKNFYFKEKGLDGPPNLFVGPHFVHFPVKIFEPVRNTRHISYLK